MINWWQCPRCTRTFESRGAVDTWVVYFGDYDGVEVCKDCFRVLCNQASPEELRRHNNIVDQINEAEERKKEERKKRDEERSAQFREKSRKEELAKEKFRKRPFLRLLNFLPFPMIVYSVLFFLGLLKLHIPVPIALVMSVIFALLSVHGHKKLFLYRKPAKNAYFYFKEKKFARVRWDFEEKDGARISTPLVADCRLYILISLVVFVLGVAVSFGVSTLGPTASDEQAVEAPADAETAQEAEGN